ncbi:MAG: hypothetical protein JXR10_10230 [Cyclobacteriaceae bacterium]
MKKVFKWVMRILLLILTPVMLVLIPIGISKLYFKISSSLLTEQEKKADDLDRLTYLFENEFSGYEVLPGTADFKTQVDKLKQMVGDNPDLSQDAFDMEVLKAVATFKDPHTAAYGRLNQRYPYSLTWSEGNFYLLAGQVDKEWLGAKVLSFDDTPSKEVFDKLNAYTTSPNEAGTAYFMNYIVAYALPLYYEGIASSTESINLKLSKNGKTGIVTFNSMPKAEVSTLTDYNRMRDLKTDYETPLYKRNFQKNYWYEYSENDDLFYLRYSFCVDQGNVESFWDEVFEELEKSNPGKLVMDVRGNPGGDAQTHNSFVNRIRKNEALNQYGKLYTLVDRGTGSAAIGFANDMERLTESIIVGEKSMDIPSTTSDPTYFTLPHSGIQLIIPNHYALNAHIYDQRDAVTPHIPIPQLLEGEAYYIDEVMDSIRNLNIQDTASEFAQLPTDLAGTYSFSPIRNASITLRDSVWYISIDQLIEAPIYTSDSSYFTRKYNMTLDLSDSTLGVINLSLHGASISLTKQNQPTRSISDLIASGDYEAAKPKIKALQVDGQLPYYLDRPFFQSKTYTVFHNEGFDQAYALNQLAKEFFPNDPIMWIVDFELYQYDGNTWGQFKSIFPIIGKLLKRYYTVITTDKIMNDQYNAFIGS